MNALMELRNKKIEENPRGQLFKDSFVAVYLQGCLNKSIPDTSFTGFTVEQSDKIFLITCLHCLFKDDECKTKINRIIAYFHIEKTDEKGTIFAKAKKFEIDVYDDTNNPGYIKLDEITDAVAFILDPLQFSNVIWNHVVISDEVAMNNQQFLHPGTRVLVVGFPDGFANTSNALMKPFWKSYFLAIEANMEDIIFIHGILPEGMSGGPVFIYKNDLENNIGMYQGLHTLQFIGMTYAGNDDAAIFNIISYKTICKLFNQS